MFLVGLYLQAVDLEARRLGTVSFQVLWLWRLPSELISISVTTYLLFFFFFLFFFCGHACVNNYVTIHVHFT